MSHRQPSHQGCPKMMTINDLNIVLSIVLLTTLLIMLNPASILLPVSIGHITRRFRQITSSLCDCSFCSWERRISLYHLLTPLLSSIHPVAHHSGGSMVLAKHWQVLVVDNESWSASYDRGLLNFPSRRWTLVVSSLSDGKSCEPRSSSQRIRFSSRIYLSS